MHVDVLVITPPKDASVRQMISRTYPGYSSVDSVPLRAASTLEQGGFSVGFLPLYNLFYNFSAAQDRDDVAAYVRGYDTDVYLLINDYYIPSRSSPCYEASLFLARLLKENNPNCSIALAGNHVSILPKAVFQDSQEADAVIKMEAEPILCTLVETLQKSTSLDGIRGIVYRENGRIRESEGYGSIADLDSLPVPAYHLLREWTEEIPQRSGRVSGLLDLTVRTSYCCPYRCAFCASAPNWNSVRFRSAEKVAEDLTNARENLKGKKASFSYFDDENFTVNIDHVKKISQMMQREDMHVDGVLASIPNLTKTLTDAISEFSGSILVGAENAVDSVLANVSKPQTFQKTLRACKNARESNLKVDLQWIIGLPGEDTRTIAENLNAIFSIIMKGEARSVSPNVLRPQPGSDIGDHPEKYGITVHHKMWSQYYSNGAYPSFSTKTLSRDQIYVYYLMAEMVASEASQIRGVYESHHLEPIVTGPEIDLFSKFMQQVGHS
jgi:anaerobic magnesium-protoporphyrin IX monomethyl ester cyclase